MDEARREIDALGLAASLGAVGSVAAAGGLITARRLSWYDNLEKPGFTPPPAIFGPVWAVLYASQAVAAWLVWRGDAAGGRYDVPALSSYWVQLSLNLAWSLLFFGLRRPAWALLEICVLWVAVAMTIREFARRHRFAAALLLPYLAWVTYAVALNAAIWHRNR
ncbi:MAG TPA: TspO/MBR family protein [Mycobacteriales bacterium]|nr:TspO/MBR family protein [Mycobacteriales bacterium]